MNYYNSIDTRVYIEPMTIVPLTTSLQLGEGKNIIGLEQDAHFYSNQDISLRILNQNGKKFPFFADNTFNLAWIRVVRPSINVKKRTAKNLSNNEMVLYCTVVLSEFTNGDFVETVNLNGTLLKIENYSVFGAGNLIQIISTPTSNIDYLFKEVNDIIIYVAFTNDPFPSMQIENYASDTFTLKSQIISDLKYFSISDIAIEENYESRELSENLNIKQEECISQQFSISFTEDEYQENLYDYIKYYGKFKLIRLSEDNLILEEYYDCIFDSPPVYKEGKEVNTRSYKILSAKMVKNRI